MNYKQADLPDGMYMLLRKTFEEYNKDGRPNKPGIKKPKNKFKNVTPKIEARGKKQDKIKKIAQKLYGGKK
tara:strand:+ start:230 stop:442 length:213 start_codon:yes stop_codon:yes gene_type:complete